jgi:NADH dehydrogenase FAD-containing subunit
MTETSPAKPTVVVIGGGYGGVNTAKSLDDVADVVLVEPKDSFVHNVASLRALVDPSWLPRIYLPYGNLRASVTVPTSAFAARSCTTWPLARPGR